MDQEVLKSDIFTKLGHCQSLELLDISGSRNIDDQAFLQMAKCEIMGIDGKNHTPGMKALTVVKISYINLTDFGLV